MSPWLIVAWAWFGLTGVVVGTFLGLAHSEARRRARHAEQMVARAESSRHAVGFAWLADGDELTRAAALGVLALLADLDEIEQRG